MICYKDMTFCTHSECLTVDCNRHTSQIKHPVDLPISYASFKATCGKYEKQEEEKMKLGYPCSTCKSRKKSGCPYINCQDTCPDYAIWYAHNNTCPLCGQQKPKKGGK